MRNNKELIPGAQIAVVARVLLTKRWLAGIGHRVKSLENPDARVVIIKSFVRKHFKSSEVFDYALEVEKGAARDGVAAFLSGFSVRQ